MFENDIFLFYNTADSRWLEVHWGGRRREIRLTENFELSKNLFTYICFQNVHTLKKYKKKKYTHIIYSHIVFTEFVRG